MSEYYAKNNPNIYFATMHPGWSDTPGISLKYYFLKNINKYLCFDFN